MSVGWQHGPRNAITDVPGVRVGHYTDRKLATGCTVILCPEAAAAAVDVRGGAPGTRETDVLALSNLVRTVNAVVFSGGSAFGLTAADGVMRWCSERGIGFETTARPIPIVSSAVLYDLGVGDPMAFPGAAEGYLAAVRARGGTVAEGSVGAGTGATIAKLMGPERSLKGGVGTASVAGPDGLIVGALVAVNALGSVNDPGTGECMAGPRGDDGGFVAVPAALEAARDSRLAGLLQNTTLICLATNAALAPEHLQRLATSGHDGLARVVVPAHTQGDGDSVFAVTLGGVAAGAESLALLGAMAAAAVQDAVLRAVTLARGLGGVPSAREWVEAPRTKRGRLN